MGEEENMVAWTPGALTATVSDAPTMLPDGSAREGGRDMGLQSNRKLHRHIGF